MFRKIIFPLIFNDQIQVCYLHFDVFLDLINFIENDTQIVYCPLEVYGYGNDEKEAQKSFKIALAEFFKYCTNTTDALKLIIK